MKKRRKSEEQRMPSDPFDAWLAMVGTLVIEPVIDMFRTTGRLIRGTRRRRRSRGHRHRRDRP